MPFEDFTLDARDGHTIHAKYRAADGDARGLIQIAHGMAEHCARYERVADRLAGAGWAVVIHDHRGHGPDCPEPDLGHFADRDGWQKVREDLRQVREAGRERQPEGKLVLLGHSMGSFIAISDQIDARGSVDALVLSGSNVGGGPLVRVAQVPARIERRRQGRRGKSKLLAFLSFGSFNKGFEGRTDFDWLSRDDAEVDAYVADDRCGFDCTNQLWVDLLGALEDNGRPDRLARIRGDLPVYIFGGSRDPVSAGGEGLVALERQLRDAWLTNVRRRIYPDGRHEMLNETNRDEVVEDLLEWLAKA